MKTTIHWKELFRFWPRNITVLKSKDISEDDEKNYEKKVQIITDEHIKSVDDKVFSKEKEKQ